MTSTSWITHEKGNFLHSAQHLFSLTLLVRPQGPQVALTEDITL